MPYYIDLMDVNSAVSIFALSIWVPALLILLAKQGSLSIPFLVFNVVLIVAAVGCSCLGIWAGFDDLADKLKHCDVHFNQ